MDAVSERIKWLLDAAFGGNASAMAEWLGVSTSTVTRWVSGESAPRRQALQIMETKGLASAWIQNGLGYFALPGEEGDDLMKRIRWDDAVVAAYKRLEADIPAEELAKLRKKLDTVRWFELGIGKQSDDARNELKRVVTRGSAVVPYYRHVIKAGNGAHVLTDEVEEFDVEAHYANTCVYEVGGDSMIDADIQEGDRLVVKLGHRFPNNGIILCRYNGELMVKGARIQDGVIWLIPANEKMHPWACKESDQFEAIGVVIEVIRKPDTVAIKRIKIDK